MKNNPVLELSFNFALDIIEYSELLEERRKFIISNQILKSGTSIGANVHEAQSSESKPDFIHKIKIAAKEADETEYWLLLCDRARNYPKNSNLLSKIKEIQRILTSIIYTSKKNS
jgi:four helix bundle protein